MGKFSAFDVPLKKLSPGVHEFTYHLDLPFFNNMENNDVHGADLSCKLTVTYKNDIYHLDFDIKGQVILLCDRCLDNLEFPIDTQYHIMVEYGDDYNDDTDDLLVIPYSDNSLNVSYMIHDTVALAIPIKHVHPLGKCNRQMTAILRKHRAGGSGGDTELEDQLIDEMEAGEAQGNDPRWDALKGMGSDD